MWSPYQRRLDVIAIVISLRKATFNHGERGVVIAMVLYLTQVKFPLLLRSGLTSLSAPNISLPMVVIGYQLSQAKIGNLIVHRCFCVPRV